MSKTPDMTEATLDTVVSVLRDNAEELFQFIAKSLVHLGARLEWDLDDNFGVTESLAGVLAPRWGLPSAGDQDGKGLAFWSTIAVDELGCDPDDVDGYPTTPDDTENNDDGSAN